MYVEKKMRQNCLRWFGHIQRRAINALVKKNELFQVERTKKSKEDQKKHYRSSKKGYDNYENNREYGFR